MHQQRSVLDEDNALTHNTLLATHVHFQRLRIGIIGQSKQLEFTWLMLNVAVDNYGSFVGISMMAKNLIARCNLENMNTLT